MIIPKNVWQTVIKILFISICLKNFQLVRSACSNIQWDCDNGQCIPDEKQCDGKVDCIDGSDEIAENCIQFHKTCQNFAFRCIYGACIEGDAKGNDVQDCADNSDELIKVVKSDEDFRGTCTDSEMQCLTSKECIDLMQLCDGVVNCRDGSDESIEVCINYICNPFGNGFQCGNGACINGNAKCNGTTECADGSDEAWGLCGTPRKKKPPKPTPAPTPSPTPTPTPAPIKPKPTTKLPTAPSPTGESCFLPNFPGLENLKFMLHPHNQTIELGTPVDEFETVHIECKNRGILRGASSLFCQNGEFNNDFPTCANFCDGKLLNRLSLRAICDYEDKFVQCPEKISPGTQIQIKCAYGYSRERNLRQDINCLLNGKFDKIPERCNMNCGKVASPTSTLSKQGFEVPVSKAPWHVAIYENHRKYVNYICGGSIISPTVIISAAHCFWDIANQAQKNSSRYLIIAGRSTSNYSTEQTVYSQLVKALEVYIPIEYAGTEEQQREDIAFIKLELPLRFSETISPICLPKDLRNDASRYMTSNREGLIHGFGERNQLERVNMRTLGYHDCKDKTPDAPIADDKFCVYTVHDALVCRGDSGGGFSIPKKDIDTGLIKYHLWGVISNSPTTRNACTRTGDQAYVAITNIFHTSSRFKSKLEIERIADEDLF